MELISINIGKVRQNPWDADVELTGIDKRPVPGPVMASAPGPKGTGAVGLAGDRVYDVKHHGGDDQAVYAYAREDYDFWEAQLGRSLHNGMFGENLTTLGLDVTGALIGERWRIGSDAVFEVSCPRIPCNTFRGWMDVKGWLKSFTAEARPGAYLRVVSPGEIRAGDPIAVEGRPDHEVTVSLMFKALTTERTLLPQLLTADAVPQTAKEEAREYLARQQQR